MRIASLTVIISTNVVRSRNDAKYRSIQMDKGILATQVQDYFIANNSYPVILTKDLTNPEDFIEESEVIVDFLEKLEWGESSS